MSTAGEHFSIRTEDATHEGEHQPTIRIRSTVEISGEWVSPEMVAYAARQFADSIAGHLRAAAAEQEHDDPGEETRP
jgi:hypothetical protein